MFFLCCWENCEVFLLLEVFAEPFWGANRTLFGALVGAHSRSHTDQEQPTSTSGKSHAQTLLHREVTSPIGTWMYASVTRLLSSRIPTAMRASWRASSGSAREPLARVLSSWRATLGRPRAASTSTNLNGRSWGAPSAQTWHPLISALRPKGLAGVMAPCKCYYYLLETMPAPAAVVDNLAKQSMRWLMRSCRRKARELSSCPMRADANCLLTSTKRAWRETKYDLLRQQNTPLLSWESISTWQNAAGSLQSKAARLFKSCLVKKELGVQLHEVATRDPETLPACAALVISPYMTVSGRVAQMAP